MAKKPRPCWKCGCKDIEIGDHNYSAFNVGWAECTGCGYKVTLSCGCFPHDFIVDQWNKSKQNLKAELREAKKEVARIEAELAEGVG
jgi:hypothetical protein